MNGITMKEIYVENYKEQHKTPTLPLPQWLAKWGYALRQASDSANGCDLEAANLLATASNIAFWNADSLNRLLLYEHKNCVEMLEAYDKIPVVTSVEEANLVKGRLDGQLLPKLLKLTTRPNIEHLLKNKTLKKENYDKYRDPVFSAIKSTVPTLVVAAANRIWIKLHIKAGKIPPNEPRFPYPATPEGLPEAEFFCPICGTIFISHKVKGDGSIEYLDCYGKDDWQCDCGAKFSVLLNFPIYNRIL